MKRFFILLSAALLAALCLSGLAARAEESRGQTEMPIGLTVLTPPDRVEYTAFDSFCAEGLTARVDYLSGRSELLSSDELTVEYLTDHDRLRYGDSGVYLSYLDFRLLLPLEVNKREYDVSHIAFSSVTRTYSGGWQAPELSGELPVGLDGIALTAKITGGGSDVGVYSVSLSFSTESRDYRAPEPRVARLEILPFPLKVEWQNTEFTYDGTPKLPVATAKNERGESIALSVQGEGLFASDSYIAHAIPPSDNYALESAVSSYRIKKADYDVSGVKWSGGSFVYDGKTKAMTLTGLPAGVRLVGYRGNEASGAGKYTAEAILEYDVRNYNPPNIPPLLWEIRKATYDMSGVYWEGERTVYNGEEQKITLVGLPDGVTVRELVGGIGTVAGRYPVRAVLDYDEANYNPPKLPEAVLIIAKKTVKIPASLALVYDGENRKIDISASEYYQKTEFFTDMLGRHTLTLELYDPINYAFEGGASTARVEVNVTLSRPLITMAAVIAALIFILLLLLAALITRRQRLRRVLAAIRCKVTLGEEILLPPPERETGAIALLSVGAERADELISNSLAKDLLEREDEPIYTSGARKSIVNVDTLSESFEAGERVDVNVLKERSLVPYDTAYLKVLARGVIDKPLNVYANDFSLAAVKMIALTGGRAVKVVTLRKKDKKKDLNT